MIPKFNISKHFQRATSIPTKFQVGKKPQFRRIFEYFLQHYLLSLVDLGVLNDRAGYETTEYETMVSLSFNRLDVFSTSDALPHLQRVTHSINSGSQMAIRFSSFAANCMFFPVCTMFDVFFGGCKGLNSSLSKTSHALQR